MAKRAAGPPRIFEASLGPDGAVRREREISEIEAVEIRKAGGDVVVTGSELKANRELARMIEHSANGGYQQHNPHDRAGSLALPHYQPTLRPPEGHTFYETSSRRSH